ARLLSLFAWLLGLDDLDAHLAEQREHILDLPGIDPLRGQHRVDLVMGDVAALLGGADELPDGRVRWVKQRAVRQGLGTLLLPPPRSPRPCLSCTAPPGAEPAPHCGPPA